jgi:hypothetical protein
VPELAFSSFSRISILVCALALELYDNIRAIHRVKNGRDKINNFFMAFVFKLNKSITYL